MKYKIELGFRGTGVKGLKLTEEEKDELLEVDDLEEVYDDWLEKKDYEFDFEYTFLTENTDRYQLTVKDENDNIVYQSDNVKDLLKNDKTWDIEDFDYEMKGEEDGYYLLDIPTIKGCWYLGDLEIDGDFDPEKFYVIQDDHISDELIGDTMYPIVLYYQKGEKPNLENDKIEMEFESDCGEQYWDIYLMELEYGDEWHNLLDE